MRQFLPLVHAVAVELSDRLPVDCDRQEVVSVGTVALAQSMMDFVDCGMMAFEDFAAHRIRVALTEEFSGSLDTVVEAKPTPVVSDEETEEVDLTGCKILIVEDSPMIRKKLRFLLERVKFEVFEAKSGEEGLWLAQECLPDLILLDVVMDGLDGFGTCERLKALPEFRDVPIVFLTGKTETEHIAHGFKVGASDYIGKPFNPHEALPRIRTHLKIRVLSAFRQRNIDELQKLNVAKDKLLRMASHDLRNPLSAIQGLTDLLKMGAAGDLNPEQSEMVETVHGAALSMMQTLSDLLDLSSLDSNQVKLTVSPGDPAEMANSLVNLFRVPATQKDIKLIFDKRGEIEPLAMDVHQIRRVVENFLSNAIKFSPRDSSIKLVVWQDEKRSYFDVEDEGPGIVPEEQKLLFKEFSRTSNKPTGGEKSTGLGLSICRRIAEEHGGGVSMSNLQPRGSRFRLELPKGTGAREEAPERMFGIERTDAPRSKTNFR